MVSVMKCALIVLSITYAELQISSSSQRGWQSYMQFNRRSEGTVITSLYSISLRACVNECVFRLPCKSVNYKRRTHYCNLNFDTENETLPLITCAEYVYVGVRNGTTLLFQHPGACSATVCSSLARCDNSSNVLSCEVYECVSQTNIPNGVTHGNKNGVNDTRAMSCELGAFLVGNTSFHCLSTGNWSEMGYCEYDCGAPQFNVTLSKSRPVIAKIYTMSDHHVLDISNISLLNNFTEYLNSSVLEFECLNGGTMEGEKFVTCNNGNWSEFPTCVNFTSSTMGSSCTSNENCTIHLSECRDGKCKCQSLHHYHYGKGECTTRCEQYADTFQEELKMRVAGYNIKSLSIQGLNGCANACIEELSFVCASFEFSKQDNLCTLQEIIGNADNFGPSSYLTYYQRDCYV